MKLTFVCDGPHGATHSPIHLIHCATPKAQEAPDTFDVLDAPISHIAADALKPACQVQRLLRAAVASKGLSKGSFGQRRVAASSSVASSSVQLTLLPALHPRSNFHINSSDLKILGAILTIYYQI